MGELDRRDVLRIGTGAMMIGGLSAWTQPRQAGEFGAPAGRKLLVISLTGGNDALNTLVPAGDAEYRRLRPRLALANGELLDAGNGFAGFHPRLVRTHALFEAGELAAIHRVGYARPKRDHVAASAVWESADPERHARGSDFLARWLAVDRPHDGLGVVTLRAEGGLELAGRRDLGALSELAGALEETPEEPASELFPADLEGLRRLGLEPDPNDVESFRRLRTSIRLLRVNRVAVVRVELGTYDSHASQGTQHAGRLALLDRTLEAVRESAGALWRNLLVLVVSEFGRSSAENAAGGTDHGAAGLVLACGGRVRGGVHHCDAASWPANETLLSEGGSAVRHLTDFRALYAEALERHLGASPEGVAAALPGFSVKDGASAAFVGYLR